MGKFRINNDEIESIKLLYENHGILLESSIWGALARVAKSLVGKSSDEIAEVFRKTEIALAKQLDDIVLKAVREKDKALTDDLVKKLIHFYNPSGSADNIPDAKEKVKMFLNGYAKSRGKKHFGEYIDEITGGKNQKIRKYNGVFYDDNMFSGNIIGDEHPIFTERKFIDKIDWDKNINAKNITELNKLIAYALKHNEFRKLPIDGFEELGIDNFQVLFWKFVEKVYEADPKLGHWKVKFKPLDFTNI